MNTSIGNKIKALRLSKGYTQKKLSEETGISEISIRKYEKGEREPKLETAVKIANALGVSSSTLIETKIVFLDSNSNNIKSDDKYYTLPICHFGYPAVNEFNQSPISDKEATININLFKKYINQKYTNKLSDLEIKNLYDKMNEFLEFEIYRLQKKKD